MVTEKFAKTSAHGSCGQYEQLISVLSAEIRPEFSKRELGGYHAESS